MILIFEAFAFLSPARAAILAAIFAVHPLNVEPVTWIAERKGLLAMACGAASLLMYARYVLTGSRWKYAAAWLFFALSLMSKQALVALPVVFLLLDWWPFRRTAIREKLPFAALSAVGCVAAVIAQGHALKVHPPLHPIRVGLENWLGYVVKSVWPTNLTPLYSYRTVSAVGTGLAVLLLVSLGAIAFHQRRRRPYIAVGLLWFTVSVLPVLGLMPVGAQDHADRYVYFPAIGLWLMFAWLPKRSWTLVAPILVLVCVSSVQVGYWRDDVPLWTHAIEVTRDNRLARAMLTAAARDTRFGNESPVTSHADSVKTLDR